jgi:hypothetical protein
MFRIAFLLIVAASTVWFAGCREIREEPRPPTNDPPAIMKLKTAHGTLGVHSGHHGLVYSVTSADGQKMPGFLTQPELQARHPDLHRIVNEGWAGR